MEHFYADILLASGRHDDAIELATTTLEHANALPERDPVLEMCAATGGFFDLLLSGGLK